MTRNNDTTDRLLTPIQTAEILGVSPTTLKKWRWERTHLPYVKLGDSRGSIRYRMSDVQSWIDASTIHPLGRED